MATEAQIRASVKFNKSRDSIMIRTDKETGAAIRKAAADKNVSVTNFILAAVAGKMAQDKDKTSPT